MRDAYEELRQKEADVARVRHEIESLLITAPLLDDEPSSDNPNAQPESSTATRLEHDPESQVIGTDVSDSHPGFWRVFKREE